MDLLRDPIPAPHGSLNMIENSGVRREIGSARVTLTEMKHDDIKRFDGSMGEQRGQNEKVGEFYQPPLNMLGNKGVIF